MDSRFLISILSTFCPNWSSVDEASCGRTRGQKDVFAVIVLICLSPYDFCICWKSTHQLGWVLSVKLFVSVFSNLPLSWFLAMTQFPPTPLVVRRDKNCLCVFSFADLIIKNTFRAHQAFHIKNSQRLIKKMQHDGAGSLTDLLCCIFVVLLISFSKLGCKHSESQDLIYSVLV